MKEKWRVVTNFPYSLSMSQNAPLTLGNYTISNDESPNYPLKIIGIVQIGRDIIEARYGPNDGLDIITAATIGSALRLLNTFELVGTWAIFSGGWLSVLHQARQRTVSSLPGLWWDKFGPLARPLSMVATSCSRKARSLRDSWPHEFKSQMSCYGRVNNHRLWHSGFCPRQRKF